MYLVLNDNNSIILQTDNSKKVNEVVTSNKKTQTFLDMESVSSLIGLLESLQKEITLVKEENFQFQQLVDDLNKELEEEVENTIQLQKEITLVKEENFQFQQLVDDLNKELEEEVENTIQLQKEITLVKEENFQFQQLVDDLNKELEEEVENTIQLQKEIIDLKEDNFQSKQIADAIREELKTLEDLYLAQLFCNKD